MTTGAGPEVLPFVLACLDGTEGLPPGRVRAMRWLLAAAGLVLDVRVGLKAKREAMLAMRPPTRPRRRGAMRAERKAPFP